MTCLKICSVLSIGLAVIGLSGIIGVFVCLTIIRQLIAQIRQQDNPSEETLP